MTTPARRPKYKMVHEIPSRSPKCRETHALATCPACKNHLHQNTTPNHDQTGYYLFEKCYTCRTFKTEYIGQDY